MLKLVFLLILLNAAAGCKKEAECRENPKPDCMCTFEFNPVCGCNEKTYSNPCHAKCAGITAYEMGACP